MILESIICPLSFIDEETEVQRVQGITVDMRKIKGLL